jgi:hypothetical protein
MAEPKPEKPRTSPDKAATASAARKRRSAIAVAKSELSGSVMAVILG